MIRLFLNDRSMHLERKYWIAIICKICMMATSFLITVFINRGLGVDGRGEYAYVVKMVEMLSVFFSIGIGQTYATFKRTLGDYVRELFYTLSLLHSMLVIVVGGAIAVVTGFEYSIETIMLTAVAVGNLIVSIMAVIENSIKRNIIVTIINLIYLTALCISYYANCLTVRNALILYGMNGFATVIFIFFTYRVKTSYKSIRNAFAGNILKDIYLKGLITMTVVFLININYSIDVIMLKRMSNAYYTGIYSVGATLLNIFLLIPEALKEVVFGESTKKTFNKENIYSSIYVSLFASGVILFFFFVWGDFAISLLYGCDYIPSYAITLVLFIGSISMILFKILHPVYIVYGKQTKAAVYLMLSAIINIVANIILIPEYNAMGAAVASVISYTLCGGLFFINYINER